MQLSDFSFIEPERAERLWRSLRGEGETANLFDQFAPALLQELAGSPEPDRALLNLERWAEALGNRLPYYRLLAETPQALQPLLKLFAVSQFLADTLIQNPEIAEILLDPVLLSRKKSAADFHRELSLMIAPSSSFLAKLDRLRHFKQRELLRIATLDILGRWSLPQVAEALSDFADACLQTAYEVCHAEYGAQYEMQGEPGFAIIGMGKLGGRELNYSSDVDLIFIRADPYQAAERQKDKGARGQGDEKTIEPLTTHHLTTQPSHPRSKRDPEAYLTKLGERIVNALSGRMRRGIVFRVDLRLRPEGRFGPIVRSLESARHYYEHWAEMWERQALLKARFVAGDPQVGEAFLRMIQPIVYRRSLREDEIEEIRCQKERSEAQTQAAGEWETDIKNGWGGIRDIEFTVQLLQLMHGGRRPRLRTPNTLDALRRLQTARIITPEQRRTLTEAYCFLRTVEHRLQLLYEHQTHILPADPAERARFARRMGFQNPEEFEQTLQAHRAAVRQLWEAMGSRQQAAARVGEWEKGGMGDKPSTPHPDSPTLPLFHSPALLSLLDTPEGHQKWLAHFQQHGFRDPEAAYHLLLIPTVGTQHGLPNPETRRAYERVVFDLIEACARTPNPDAAWKGIESLATAVPNRAQLYATFAGSQQVMERLCELAISPSLWRLLLAYQELLDMLFGEEILEPGAKPLERFQDQLTARLSACRTERARLSNLAAYARRERLRIGARDLWGETDPLETAEDLSNLADTLLKTVWKMAIEQLAAVSHQPSAASQPPSSTTHPLAEEVRAVGEECLLIGFGKLGGKELGYMSDWDLGFVCPDSVEGVHGSPLQIATQIAETFLNLCQTLQAQDAFRAIDTRLRPEGRSGALVLTLSGYRQYYAGRAEPWERLAATRIRVIKPSALTQAFEAMLHEFLYARPLSEEEFLAIRHLRQRMQTERVKPEERTRHLKLGYGGLSDVEFTAQLLLLRTPSPPHPLTTPHLLPTNTWQMLVLLHRAGVLPRAQYDTFAQAFRFLYQLRNRLALLFEPSLDLLPEEEEKLAMLAHSLNLESSQELLARYKAHTEAVARLAETYWK